MNKLTALIEAAKAATPGPWESGEFSTAHFMDTNHKYFVGTELRRVASVEGVGRAYEADATFIALANPATIPELCALLEKAEEDLVFARQVLSDHRIAYISEALAAIKQWKEQT